MNIDIEKLIRKVCYTTVHSPELNRNNYNSDDVEKLNDAMIEIVNMLYDIIDKIEEDK